jgi:hypothetical protein
MKSPSGLTGVLAVILIAGAVLLGLGYLVEQGITQFITPPPEQVAEGLVNALGARRYEGALNQLSHDLKANLIQAELEELVRGIESAHGGIQQATGERSQEQGDTATASVRVKTKDLQVHDLELELKQEQGIWRVSSLEPVRTLAAK